MKKEAPELFGGQGDAHMSPSSSLGLRTMHSVQVSGLSANTNYYYVIHVTDQAGNVSVTWPAVMHTNQ